MAYNREQENAAAADLIRSRLAQRQNVDGEIRSLLEDSTKRMQTLAGRGAPKNSTEAAVMRNAANNALSDFQNSSARLRSLLEQDRGLSDGDYTNQALEALNQRERQLRSASRQTLPDVSGALKLGAQALAASAANGGSKSKLVEWQTRPYMSAAEEADYNGLTAAQIRLNHPRTQSPSAMLPGKIIRSWRNKRHRFSGKSTSCYRRKRKRNARTKSARWKR